MLIFLMLCIPTGLMFATLNPAGQVPDEGAQSVRVAAAAWGHFVGTRKQAEPGWIQSGIVASPALVFVSDGPDLKKVDAALIAKHRSVTWDVPTDFIEIGTIAVYFPSFYLPAALGTRLAHALGAIPADAFLIARVASLMVFAVFGVLALRIARRGRALMFCTLSTPMTLMLAGSLNQDGLLIATAVLAAALMTAPTPRRRVAAAVLIACIGAAKPPYLPLAILLLLPLPEPGQWRAMLPDMSRRFGIGVIAVSLPLLWTAWMLTTVSTPTHWPAYAAGPLWPGTPGQVFTETDARTQLQVLLAEPSRFITLPLQTIMRDTWPIKQAIGLLGWLNIFLPKWLYGVWMVAIGCAALADLCRRHAPVRALESVMLLAVAVLIVWAVYLSQYLTWSQIGLSYIEGPTGRYLLPVVPLVALALPRLRHGGWPRLQAWLSAAPAIAVLCGLVVLPSLLVGSYYLR